MPESQMLINYVPGEECRVAIVEDGKLEELYVEKFAQASRVGNIYVGKVVNVEAAIQAAFVDFGCGENGFLHVTDLHPRYFPGEGDDTTERVGFKTPRRERPPIQAALRRGDEVIVQVLKEGVGTKGPTVTSYLSIPGRFLVMMPQMDKVGVSRKVEDEEQRRQMRDILDQLELPEGFGFILRTAGLSRTKAELKRDLAYLQRLWKDMDRRLATGGKPRLLYSESDLLVRSLRDMLNNDVHEVVIDNEVALRRASRFMKIVAPRGTTKLMHFPDKTPMFHAFGIERQIALIHAREVPLPSGGRLVIDQTEALVAIDVNSGKSRDSRDAETNAYQTNIEAVDEICRQLRLRDMGGIVINDLIDMRDSRHRKDIENRFKERMKRDRAKTTTLAISEFGILEMTRQRMRPSHESMHFTDCPTCRGRGMLQRPDSVAADALRDMAAILDVEKVNKVEMVVAPRVASELLSTKRQLLSRTERIYAKHVDVRVSETVPVDRVSFYAYDPAGADLEIAGLPQPKKPKNLVAWEEPGSDEWAMNEDEEKAALPPEPADEEAENAGVHPIEVDESGAEQGWANDAAAGQQERQGEGEGGGRRRRRRGRGGRGGAAEARGPVGRAPDGRGQGRAPQGGAANVPRGDDRGPGRDGDGRGQGGRGPGGPPPGRGQRGPDPRSAPARGPVTPSRGEQDPREEHEAEIAASQQHDPEWGDAPVVRPRPERVEDDAAVEPAASEDAHLEFGDGAEGQRPPEGDALDQERAGAAGGEGNLAAPEEEPRRGRRRRRRRGGRGRGRGGEAGMEEAAPGGDHHGPGEQGSMPMEGESHDGAAEPAPSHEPHMGEDPETDGATSRDAGAFAGDAEPADEPGDVRDADGSEGDADQVGTPADGAPGTGARKRRRRRGRGGRASASQEGRVPSPAPQGGGQRPPPPPRSNDRGPARGGDRPSAARGEPRGERRGGRPAAREASPPPSPRPAPRAAPAPVKPAAPAPAARPRTLYAASRRKLAPSELNRKAKPE